MNLRVKHPIIDVDDVDKGLTPLVGAQTPLDVGALWRVLVARKKVLFGAMATVLGVAMLGLLVIVPTFSATAVMMLDQRKNAVADVNAVLSGLPTDESSVQNQIQVLTSRHLAARVVDKLKLDQDSEFNAELSSGWFGSRNDSGAARLAIDQAKGRETAIDRLQKRISVEQVGLSTTMTVSVSSVDAQKSARLTNAVVDAYVEDQLGAKYEATQKAGAWLANRVRETSAQVQADEAAVQKYKAEHGIIDTVGGGSIVDQQTASVSVQLINARADLAQKSALYERALELQREGRAVEASQVVASPLIAQLRAQEADLARQEAQLSSRYLPQHPKMVDIQSQKADTRSKIAAEVRRVIDSLANDVAVGRANVQSLESSLNQLQSKFQTQNTASAKLKALESTASSSRSIYEGLLSRLKEIQGQEGIATSDVRIITRAITPTTASPRPLQVIGLAIPASLALGMLLVFLVEGLDPSLRTTEHVDKYLGLSVLASVPESGALPEGRSVADLMIDEPGSVFAEAIRGLHLNLSLSSADRAPKVLLVTSSVPGEGKTSVAVSLARLAARNGRRVVIVDADFRRPAIARAMGLGPQTTGVVDVLEGRTPLESAVVGDSRSQALALPGVDGAVNPSDLLTSDVLEKLIASLRARYDLVVVDSAPILPVHDTLALSQFCDAALFVTHSGKTPRDAVAAGLRALKSMKANVVGVVLTHARLDSRYGYHEYVYGSRPRALEAANAQLKRLPGPSTVMGRLRDLVFHTEEGSPRSGQ